MTGHPDEFDPACARCAGPRGRAAGGGSVFDQLILAHWDEPGFDTDTLDRWDRLAMAALKDAFGERLDPEPGADS